MKTEFNQREIALLSLSLQFSLSNIDAIEEIADEHLQDELEQLKNKVDKI
jgi:demethoxyubiquinone hydroxylase (CLK1/Coq7/Cat5 family)